MNSPGLNLPLTQPMKTTMSQISFHSRTGLPDAEQPQFFESLGLPPDLSDNSMRRFQQ